MKKRIILSVLLIAALTVLCGCKAEKKLSEGKVTFTAVDGISGLPIENVRIVLPENGIETVTGADGKCEEVTVSVSKDGRYPIVQDYGTFTVFAFKDGYSDYALFYARIKENDKRNMKIFLFSENSPLSKGLPISIIESPDEEWVKEYIAQYK